MKNFLMLLVRLLAIALGLSLVSDSIAYLPVKRAATLDFWKVASLIFWIATGLGLANLGLLFGYRKYSSSMKKVCVVVAVAMTVPISIGIAVQMWKCWRS